MIKEAMIKAMIKDQVHPAERVVLELEPSGSDGNPVWVWSRS
jgi:hypothetical protein